jgi:PTS system ascorbate-specific IIA component
MIGLLIIAHGGFGESLIHSASHVIGKRPIRLRSLAVHAQDRPESVAEDAQKLVQELDQGQGVLILSDMCGGTPCNVANSLRRPGHVEVISGANLPMLVRAITYREESLSALVDKAMAGGTQGVIYHRLENTVTVGG